MKKLLMSMILVSSLSAMEYDIENPKPPVRANSDQIASQLANVIIQLGSNVSTHEDQFKQLVVAYFKKESIAVEDTIMPFLKQKLRDSDSALNEILEKDDKAKLEEFIHILISESIEEAFNEKESQYDELKLMADDRLKKSRYALATAIVSGVAGILSMFFGVYFGENCA